MHITKSLILKVKVTNLAKNLLFSECCHVAYQIKENEMYGNIQANILGLRTPSTPGMASKGQTFFSSSYQIKGNAVYNNMQAKFPEYGHVTYQIKGNATYNKMQANILPVHTLLAPGVRSKG